MSYIINRIKSIQFKRMNEVIKREARNNNKSLFKTRFDFLKCALKYKMGYIDYMKCNVINLSKKDRENLFTGENYRKLLSYLNPIKYRVVMDDKVICNRIFHNFIKRDFIDLRVTSLKDFQDFLKNKTNVFAKLVDGFGGDGVTKIKIKEIKDLNLLYNKLIKNRQFLIEEEIIQHKTMNEINKFAVNNIRIITLLKDNEVHIIERVLRINDGLSDTISSHDIQGRLDDDGNLISNMADDDLVIFDKHPVTNYEFKNIKIPHMNKAIDVCKKAALVVPNIRLIGFDIAIVNDGVDIIEVNPYPCYTNYQYYKIHNPNEKMSYYKKVKDILKEEVSKIK